MSQPSSMTPMKAVPWHFNARIIQRSKGESVIQSAAYQSRGKLINGRTGEIADYSHHEVEDLVFSQIVAPELVPEWVQDREVLWNEVEQVEKRKDAQLARRIIIALPHELTDEQREKLVTQFARDHFSSHGMVADVAIHSPHEGMSEKNHHVHILVGLRVLTKDGFGAKVRLGVTRKEWMEAEKEMLQKWKDGFARLISIELEKSRFRLEAERWRHGHKKLSEQRDEALARRDKEYAERLVRVPTLHLGSRAAGMERQGVETERGDQNRAIEIRNLELLRLIEMERSVQREIEYLDPYERILRERNERQLESQRSKGVDWEYGR